MMQISELVEQYRLFDVKDVDEDGDSLLHLVMKDETFPSEQVVEVVRILLNEGVDPNIKNEKEQTVLHFAVAKRAKDVIDCLLTRKVELGHSIAHHLIEEENKKFEFLTSDPLRVSDCEMQKMENESANFVEWIVSKGLDIDGVHESYCDGPCALLSAIEKDLQHIIPILTKHTKDIKFIKKKEYSIGDFDDHNHEENLKGTVLHLFLDQMGNNRKYQFNEAKITWYNKYTDRYATSVVRTMLDKGVPTDAVNGFGNTALHVAVLQKENINIVEMLIEHTTNVNRKNEEGKTPFYIVIYKWLESKKRDVEYYSKISRALVDKGADVNEPDQCGSSPLGNAVERKSMKVIKFLRDSGADFSLIPNGGESLMYLLVEKGYSKTKDKKVEVKLLDFLIANGCPVNANEKQHSGNTPLHVAAKDGSVEFVRKLIKHGADVNCKNDKGDTPLHCICEHKPYQQSVSQAMDMAEILLKLGANVNAMNSEDATPLHLVAVSNRKGRAAAFLKFLLEHGADMSKGFSVIHLALWKDYNQDSLSEDSTDLHNIPDLFDCIEDYASDEVELLLRHWVKIDAAKLRYRVRGYIDEDLKNLVTLSKYRRIYQKCLAEVKALKSDFIDSRVSLYGFLHMDPTSRCIYINHEKLKDLVDSLEIEKQFPECAALILAAYRESTTRKLLLKPVRATWLEITGIVLPDICIERIFSFLDNSDLFKFIEKN